MDGGHGEVEGDEEAEGGHAGGGRWHRHGESKRENAGETACGTLNEEQPRIFKTDLACRWPRIGI